MEWNPTISLFCDKVIEVTGEVKRRNRGFYNQDPKMEASGFWTHWTHFSVSLKPTGCVTWKQPEDPLQYIQNSPNQTLPTRTCFSTVKHAGWKTSPRHLSVPKYLYQKGQHSSEKTKELLWRLEWTDVDWTANPFSSFRHFNLERTCSRVGFCSMMRTSSVSM